MYVVLPVSQCESPGLERFNEASSITEVSSFVKMKE